MEFSCSKKKEVICEQRGFSSYFSCYFVIFQSLASQSSFFDSVFEEYMNTKNAEITLGCGTAEVISLVFWFKKHEEHLITFTYNNILRNSPPS